MPFFSFSFPCADLVILPSIVVILTLNSFFHFSIVIIVLSWTCWISFRCCSWRFVTILLCVVDSSPLRLGSVTMSSTDCDFKVIEGCISLAEALRLRWEATSELCLKLICTGGESVLAVMTCVPKEEGCAWRANFGEFGRMFPSWSDSSSKSDSSSWLMLKWMAFLCEVAYSICGMMAVIHVFLELSEAILKTQ